MDEQESWRTVGRAGLDAAGEFGAQSEHRVTALAEAGHLDVMRHRLGDHFQIARVGIIRGTSIKDEGGEIAAPVGGATCEQGGSGDRHCGFVLLSDQREVRARLSTKHARRRVLDRDRITKPDLEGRGTSLWC